VSAADAGPVSAGPGPAAPASAEGRPGGGRDPHRIGRHGRRAASKGHGRGGPAAKRIIVGYGFWIFLLSDFVMFSGFFATYAVLRDQTAGGPGAHQLFDLTDTAMETACLLSSSFTCGLMSLALERGKRLEMEAWLLVTGLLGAGFLFLELREFAGLIAHGNGPQRSAFLTAFFTLVGCHGLHVTVGLLWLGTMMAQAWAKGLRQDIRLRLLCFSLFWHALDIIWVAIFTLVYLIGARG
jgi:cytochrome o ubiquinol oxidase subunit 3